MLSQAVLVGALAAAGIVVTTTPADADGDVACPPRSPYCIVEVVDPRTSGDPGSDDGGGGSSSGGSERHCYEKWTGDEIACYDEYWGWWDDESSCYWKLLETQPPDSVTWEGHYPDGAIYAVMCFPVYPLSSAGGWAWRATPPPGYGGIAATPAQLAQRAVDQMKLTGPDIRMSIPADKFATVGVPVWLWTDVTSTTWGPNSATASVPGLSVTATANARQIVWDTGDGRSETCRNPGTPYYTGGVVSPTCQHVYERSSADQPDTAYSVTATTTWDVTWTGGGTSGSLTVTRVSTGSVRVGEVQVLVTTS